jgi:hypothetical protein
MNKLSHYQVKGTVTPGGDTFRGVRRQYGIKRLSTDTPDALYMHFNSWCDANKFPFSHFSGKVVGYLS